MRGGLARPSAGPRDARCACASIMYRHVPIVPRISRRHSAAAIGGASCRICNAIGSSVAHHRAPCSRIDHVANIAAHLQHVARDATPPPAGFAIHRSMTHDVHRCDISVAPRCGGEFLLTPARPPHRGSTQSARRREATTGVRRTAPRSRPAGVVRNDNGEESIEIPPMRFLHLRQTVGEPGLDKFHR